MKKILTPVEHLVSPDEQGADFVELFFDLVFVFAITRITGLAAEHFSVTSVVQSVLIFWLIWWGWTQFTWALNAANTRIAEVRMGVLIATAVAFVLAASITEAFSDKVMWFAIPYVIIRVLGLGLYIRVTSNHKDQQSAATMFALLSITGLVAVIGGALVSPGQRVIWWLAAILLDLMASGIGGRSEGFNLRPKHFAERHGLIVIIALGESLIVAASAFDIQERTQALLVNGGLAVIVTCLLWWSYFSWINEHLENHFAKTKKVERGRSARDAYSVMHFPLICGIIGIAIGFEKIIGHPHDVLSVPVALALGGGYVLFVSFTAASVWRMSGLFLAPRMIIVLISVIGIALSVGQPPAIAFTVIATGLMALIFIEWKKCRHS
ncbi:MAG: low temperature requirement protein A [Candidatus Marinimicrobia bacterium]|nr:low temperature requirement protein A [Candidatus Neomarinimicrobiota bacterium]